MKSLPADLVPTSCVDADLPSACELTWLPLCVRFKLDECGLRLSLHGWQQLSIAQRAALVQSPLQASEDGFQSVAIASGASDDSDRPRGLMPPISPSDLEPLCVADAARWLAGATPFAKYVAAKLARKEAFDEATRLAAGRD